MGRGAGRFMAGSECFFPALLRLRAGVAELVAENPNDLVLPDDAVIVCFHQGYEYEFFRTSEGEDPPIYQCFEGHKGIAFRWTNFAEYFCEMVRSHIE